LINDIILDLLPDSCLRFPIVPFILLEDRVNEMSEERRGERRADMREERREEKGGRRNERRLNETGEERAEDGGCRNRFASSKCRVSFRTNVQARNLDGLLTDS
jgi:hypothetical protein